MFQSLKGFQRFCGIKSWVSCKGKPVSIPKRVSEVLWQMQSVTDDVMGCVSIPKRVSEVLWHYPITGVKMQSVFQSLKGFQRFCGAIAKFGEAAIVRFNP